MLIFFRWEEYHQFCAKKAYKRTTKQADTFQDEMYGNQRFLQKLFYIRTFVSVAADKMVFVLTYSF